MFNFVHALRNTPIERKLTIITMAATGTALLLAGIITFHYEIFSNVGTLERDLSITADMVGDNIASALVFGDAEAAAQTLRSLQKNTSIRAAVIYDKAGHEFVAYRSIGEESFQAPPLPRLGIVTMPLEGTLQISRNINLTGETVGRIFINSRMNPVIERINRFMLLYALSIVVALTSGFFLVNKLRPAISRPISDLSAAAQRVASEKDYSIRARKYGDDELGQLIDGFNEMLNQIQLRDRALQEASATLEKRVEERTEELQRSLARLNAIFESTADGILAVHFTGESRCNSQYQRMWGIPKHLLNRQYDDQERLAWIASQTTDPENFHKEVDELRHRPEIERFSIIELKDGRTFERCVKPERFDGEVVGIVIDFRDITARKQAERELEAAHKQLLERSRLAGMAEVAAGVLHNVGNVLNSVNVSAGVIGDSAKNSKVTSLTKLVSLLEAHKDDIAAYITSDPNGRHFREFLTQLTRHLLAEQRIVVAEAENLRANIEHVKQIVAMQQTYSKASGFKETVDIGELIRNALRINEVSLQRHGIEVVERISGTTLINTEKHKVLQILVNLIRNAKLACQESGRADKRLALQTRVEKDVVTISVIDNGIGIPPENLTRIFNHGFTTRKDGHGFGLHSGALAARELGGSLRAFSDGIGHGARFTLELPLREQESTHE